MQVEKILLKMNLEIQNAHLEIESFKSEEDGSEYAVWKIKINDKYYVLKKAKAYELSVYTIFLNKLQHAVPHLYKTIDYDNSDYILIDYIDGQTMSKCTRNGLIKAVDALISIQKTFWNAVEPVGFEYSFDKTLENRKNRGKYLNDLELEQVYAKFIEYYQKIPRTLCHDDLLPFNVLINQEGWIIDWEFAGIMPYLTSFTRLIAHSEEKEDAFFFMKDEDKAFIIDYYYEHFVQEQGITYDEYQLGLKYFLLYEYAEWIMLGVKYNNTDSLRYIEYYQKAKQLVKELKNED